MSTQKQNGFASSLGFVLASAGSAVGLGNIWGFPYKTGANGGAAFVIVYILMALLLGIVGMVAEMYVGRRAQANPVTALKKINPKLGFIGLIAVAVPFFIICYYSVLGGYTIRGAVASFSDIGKSTAAVSEGFAGFMSNPWLPAVCTFIFLALAVLIITGGVQKGIEKASKVLMPLLFIILLGVMIYCLCLGDGVREGLDFYILKADFRELGWDGVAAAMGQVFFSMSLGMGIMISYGSYTGKEINLFKSAVQISLIDTAIALMAGLAIFPAAFHFIETSGVAAEDVGLGGFALMFKTLPMVFNSLGTVGGIIGAFFFLMVSIAAITSVVSLVEVVTQFVIQKFKISRKRAAIIPMIFAMLISVLVSLSLGGHFDLFGFDLLTFFDEITNTVLMPICALAVCLAAGYGISKREMAKNIYPEKPFFGSFVSYMTRFVTPLLILVVAVFGMVSQTMQNPTYYTVLISAACFCLLAGSVYFFAHFDRKDTGHNRDEK